LGTCTVVYCTIAYCTVRNLISARMGSRDERYGIRLGQFANTHSHRYIIVVEYTDVSTSVYYTIHNTTVIPDIILSTTTDSGYCRKPIYMIGRARITIYYQETSNQLQASEQNICSLHSQTRPPSYARFHSRLINQGQNVFKCVFLIHGIAVVLSLL
jgi:hypothetical protein